jgi:hypothetical protein
MEPGKSPVKMSPSKIIHLDLDAFFCAAEELRARDKKGRRS